MPFLSQIATTVETAFKAEVSEDLHFLASIAMLQLKKELKSHLNKSEDELISTSKDQCGLNHATYFGMMVGKEIHEKSQTIKDHFIFVCTENSGQKVAEELVWLTHVEVTKKLEALEESKTETHTPSI